jgi:hypothetical protein
MINNKVMKNNRIVKIIPILFVAGIISVYFLGSAIFQAKAQEQNSDAIGVRIVPNPNHYSVYRWYESQGFSGSPQSLTVDGYEALRDGRTVYVNAANVDTNAKVVYTNIYLISYNQDYNVKTVDILGQLISHWKFNDNLPLQTSTCSISALKCEQDSDCASNQTCSNSDVCVLKEAKNCSVDEDCPASFFCGSLKAKIIRDLKRVGKLEEIKEALANYRKTNGRYPLLSAGTYLSGKSVSLWPSWNDILIPTLAIKQTLVDPINRLGACPGFNSKTCWNDSTKKFVYDASGAYLKLPRDSYALVYGTNETGSDYNLCAVLETHSDPNYTFSPNDPIASACVTETGILAAGNSSNSAPKITSIALKGVSGSEYNGFVQAVDDDGDSLTWSMQPLTASWPNWQGAPPIIKDTSELGQKKIYAARAGNAGKYPIAITVSDSNGASVSTTTSIEIGSLSSFAQAEDYTYHLDPTVPFNYNFYVAGSSNIPTYTLSLVSGPDILRMPGIVRVASADGLNRQKVNYQGIISTAQKFTADVESHYRLSVASAAGAPAVNDFIIKIIVDKPVLNFNCATQSRINYAYKCSLGSTKQGNHALTYSVVSAMPAGLSLSATSNNQDAVYLVGNTVAAKVGQEVKINVVNEYGVASEKSFVLDVNTYCGDGVRETPNTEGKGGVKNDGQEACDGSANVVSTASASNKNNQYACNTTAIAATPYPITTSGYCIFKSPLDGGGYCGDTYCQTKYEDINSCPFDCDPNYFGVNPSLGEGKEVPLDCNNGLYCNVGYECTSSGTCQKKCWVTTEKDAKSVTVSEGDAVLANKDYLTWVDTYKQPRMTYTSLEINNNFIGGTKVCHESNEGVATPSPLRDCSFVGLDNTRCISKWASDAASAIADSAAKYTYCPIGFQNKLTPLSYRSQDQCKMVWNDLGGWRTRVQWTCTGDLAVTRCYQDDCRTTGSTVLDGTLDENGICVKKVVVPSDTDGNICNSTLADSCPTGQHCEGAYGHCESRDNGQTGNYGAECAQYDEYYCPGANVVGGCDWVVDQSGTCVADANTNTCTPSCPTNYCGTDGCSGTCSCVSSGYDCTNNQCVLAAQSCPQGVIDGYSYPAIKYGSSYVVKTNVDFHPEGGYYSTNIACSSSGVVTNTGTTGPTANPGYRCTSGEWYQSTYGYYNVCLANCVAGTVSGYAYDALESGGSNSTQTVTKIVGTQKCTATANCMDGGVIITNENCVSAPTESCGNGNCGIGETVSNCPFDCVGTCGDGICNTANSMESVYNCYPDCGGMPCTGDSDCTGTGGSYCISFGYSSGSCSGGLCSCY